MTYTKSDGSTYMLEQPVLLMRVNQKGDVLSMLGTCYRGFVTVNGWTRSLTDSDADRKSASDAIREAYINDGADYHGIAVCRMNRRMAAAYGRQE